MLIIAKISKKVAYFCRPLLQENGIKSRWEKEHFEEVGSASDTQMEKQTEGAMGIEKNHHSKTTVYDGRKERFKQLIVP